MASSDCSISYGWCFTHMSRSCHLIRQVILDGVAIGPFEVPLRLHDGAPQFGSAEESR